MVLVLIIGNWIRRWFKTSSRVLIKKSDLRSLFENPYRRFEESSPLVGHILLKGNRAEQYLDGQVFGEIIHQPGLPQIIPLEHLHLNASESFSKGGQQRFKSRRAVRIQIADEKTEACEDARLLFFSPERKNQFEKSNVPLTQGDELKESFNLKNSKGGYWLTVERSAIAKRQGMKRCPSQKQVMGKRSAKKAYQESLAKTKMKQKQIRDKLQASLSGVCRQLEPEWMHLYGFRLSPLSYNPQTKANLMAGPAFFNNAMLIFERLAEFLVNHLPEKDSEVKIWTTFIPLQNSDVIQYGEFRLKVRYQNRSVTLYQYYHLALDPHPGPKSTDLAQLSLVVSHLLENKPGQPLLFQGNALNVKEAIFNLNQAADLPCIQNKLINLR